MNSEKLLHNLLYPKNWLAMITDETIHNHTRSEKYVYVLRDGFEITIHMHDSITSRYLKPTADIMIKSPDVKIMMTVPIKVQHQPGTIVFDADFIDFYSIRFLTNKPDISKIEDALFETILLAKI